ncbi:NAD(P)-dependent oxidoreductase [Tatumella saanichensis]|uniref:NAD(P)-dependent oxidoreductase n=1 Tax=Tatumella saanichensis TaxID=480813 RepID=UPI0004B0D69D|nr:NAD(P)-dependent oxidoreductase [Tatumella saanichensis]
MAVLSSGRYVFADYASLDFGDLDPQVLQAAFPGVILYAETAPSQIVERLREAEVVLISELHLSAEILQQLPALKLILLAATGTNAVDLPAARWQGITVCNCRGYGTHSVAQHTLALLLALTNHVAPYHRLVSDGRWSDSPRFCLTDYPLNGLNGRQLVIAGQGELGNKVAEMARVFGLSVRFAALPGRPCTPDKLPLDSLLPQADILSLHCPLTDETAGMINGQRLAMMKPGALLINTARGGLIDEPALAATLRSGRLGGAALDVLSQEPPPRDHPLLADDIPNLLITPHIAWGTTDARQMAVQQLIENYQAWRCGAPIREVS